MRFSCGEIKGIVPLLSARPSIGKSNNNYNKKQDPIGGEVLLDLNVPAVDFISSVGGDYKFAAELFKRSNEHTHTHSGELAGCDKICCAMFSAWRLF